MTRRLAVALACCLALGRPAIAQTIQLVDEAKLPRFEVASVKPGDPNADRATIGTPPGRFVQQDMNLLSALGMAFGVRLYQFGTLPDDMARANMTAIAEEILPHFRDRLPQGARREAAE